MENELVCCHFASDTGLPRKGRVVVDGILIAEFKQCGKTW